MRRQLIRIGSVSLLLAPFVCAEARTVTVTGTNSEAIVAPFIKRVTPNPGHGSKARHRTRRCCDLRARRRRSS